MSGDGTRALQEMLLDPGSGGLDFISTPHSIAAEMDEAMQEIGGNGFLIQDPLTGEAVVEIADRLVPALQRRGVVRTAYGHDLFRNNSLAFWMTTRRRMNLVAYSKTGPTANRPGG